MSVPLPPLGSRGSEDRAQIFTIGAARAIAAAFPQIRSIGLWRPPDGYNEHSSGSAADVMIPDWNTPQGKTLGDQVCAYALTLQGVDYVIWRQAMHYRGGRVTGMSDRGSPTQNHMDHNHVHTTGGGYPGPGQQYFAPGAPGPVTVGARYWPLGAGRVVTSPFGPRSGGFHAGADFGRDGGSAGMPVYACQGGTVIKAGAASGYGGPDPAGWLVVDHSDADGAGCTEYGHIIREVALGQRVEAGQRIGRINPDQGTNGGVAPHLHLSLMPREYNPGAKIDPLPWLAGAREPGAAAPPPPPPQPQVLAQVILAQATGITLAKAGEILAQVSFALAKANCTNPRRIAAALAQWVVESGHFVYTEEIASGPETQERWKYKGRTWVQLTWLENYLGFSEWCHSLGLVPTPDYFVVRPRELADQKWAALGPAYWWAVKYPQINEYADRGDIDNVSKWVNAPAWVDNPNKHANHEAERRAAYLKALALGDQLLALLDDTDLDPWEALLMSNESLESISIYATPGEAKRYTPAQMLQSIDGMAHRALIEDDARLADVDAIGRIVLVAKGQGKYRDAAAVRHAIAVLADLEKTNPAALQAFIAARKG